MRSLTTTLGGRQLTIEVGKLAKQAHGSATVRCGDTVILATATASSKPKEDQDFLPLTVDYIEKTFAAGKIPGGFFKREGRPSELEVLTGRFIDRPMRPLFPDGYWNETQVIVTVLSADNENEPDVLAIIGASAALHISQIPFLGPIAGVCVGRVDGKFVINPPPEQMERSDLDLIVAGSKDAVVMVEGGAKEIPEKDLVEAIMFAHREMQPVLELQEELKKLVGAVKWEVKPTPAGEMTSQISNILGGRLRDALTVQTKRERHAAVDSLREEVVLKLADPENPSTASKIETAFGELERKIVRDMILSEKRRVDGRGPKEIRPITCEVALLPRTHGSALFTRGETQALVVTTLGTKEDQQLIDNIMKEYYKRFMLHYNFPPFSVGEVKFLRSPGRREIGHGALAERALNLVLPSDEEFPYTIRTVSEILESNGSSSMATVCGGTLSLMDAGVPIKSPVSGIAMGLVKEDGKYVVLSDILGDEDYLGDMDFKVAGTAKGITAIQMDVKIGGINEAILSEALGQAREGRLAILEKMLQTLPESRKEISQYAPKIVILKIPKDKIGALIGPGGKNIRAITEATGAKIDVDEDGTVHIAAVESEAGEMALRMVKASTAVPEVGKYYRGKVQKIMEFGAFVEILPGIDGLVHVSQLDTKHVRYVEDVLHEGDEVVVKVLEIDERTGKVRLSRKDAIGHEKEVEE